MSRAASLLLLAASLVLMRTHNTTWPFALPEDQGCPAAPSDLVEHFITGNDTGTPLTRASASTLACHTLLILARDAAGNNTAGDLLRTMYTAWLKQYRPQTWHAANASRVNWLASLAAIANHNILLANRYYTAPNQYTDLSPAEFTASVLMPATPQQAGTPATPARKLLARGSVSVPVPTYPLTINWMTAGKVLPAVGFQAMCGSSWAFASAAALESNLMIATKASSVDAVSPQHIMDCTANLYGYTKSACNGGSPANAFAFAAARGMAADAAYRYRPLNGGADVDTRGFLAQCDRAFLVGKAAKMGLVAITTTPAFTVVAPNKLALITALGQQPAVATIPVDAMVQHYAGGIYSTNTCAGSPYSQSFLLVGYDATKAGQEYFLAKTSLGQAWGDNGVMKIAMADGAGACGMYVRVVQPGTVAAVAPTKPGNGKS